MPATRSLAFNVGDIGGIPEMPPISDQNLRTNHFRFYFLVQLYDLIS